MNIWLAYKGIIRERAMIMNSDKNVKMEILIDFRRDSGNTFLRICAEGSRFSS